MCMYVCVCVCEREREREREGGGEYGVLCDCFNRFPAEEYNYYNSGLIPSMFYQSLAEKDLTSFKADLWSAAVVVLSVCIVSH